LLGFLSDTLFAILPKGTVRDEGNFLILVAILAGLIVVGYLMRKRRNRQCE
jgi:LPXTG-motif cell wall-anchored protein